MQWEADWGVWVVREEMFFFIIIRFWTGNMAVQGFYSRGHCVIYLEKKKNPIVPKSIFPIDGTKKIYKTSDKTC